MSVGMMRLVSFFLPHRSRSQLFFSLVGFTCVGDFSLYLV